MGWKLRYFLTEFHGSYTSIVTRAPYFGCVLCLLFSSASNAQSRTAAEPGNTAIQQQKQGSIAQSPKAGTSTAKPSEDEGDPPEEDESVAPEKFTLNPLESERNVKVGNYYWHKGKYRAAAERYTRATRFNPTSAEAFFKLGEAEQKLNNQEAAGSAFQKVMQIAPGSKLASEAKRKLGSKG